MLSMPKENSTYRAAGVDIEAADNLKRLIKEEAEKTRIPGVLAGPGLFGGLFELQGFTEPVLVSSTDGVGTKLLLSATLDRYMDSGQDIVNHCVNDILTCGATPLFFLDYIAMGSLNPGHVIDIVKGMSIACQEAGCALIGGESAEMPGIYQGSTYELVGFIVGVVEKARLITGIDIRKGDSVLGLPSSGLHTNGFSLVRRIFGLSPQVLGRYYPELSATLGEALLSVHRSYLHELKPLLGFVKGLAHITGGGMPGNIPRVLPPGMGVRIKEAAWEIPPLFRLIETEGNVDHAEMYRVFNMGIGMAIITDPEGAAKIKAALPEAIEIGEVIEDPNQGVIIE